MHRLVLAISFVLIACGDDATDRPDAAPSPDAAGSLTVSIPFSAKIGGTAFACGQTYTVGSGASAYVASDFRLYVHDVKLVGASGDVPVTLDANDFQANGVVLLDFEDGTAACQMGSPATHTSITGTVPRGDYTGVKFKVGVPFDQNHLDVATAAAPLNVPAMYWAWSGGHKFLKTDGAVAGAGFNLHLGSTACGVMGTTPPTSPCANPNTIDVTLASFTLDKTVVVDTGPVLADVDVSANTMNTPPGCMSAPADPECEKVFPKLGLAYGAIPAGTLSLFAVE